MDSTLKRYYKCRVSKTLKFEMNEEVNKKRIGDEIDYPGAVSPSKTPKLKQETESLNVINLISDDEDHEFDSMIEENKDILEEILSDSSNSTINYTPPKIKSISPSTPKTPLSSKKIYFSPTKKRSVSVKTPSKVRKNLTKDLCGLDGNIEFHQACEGLDDKTIFLVKIIYQYLNDAKLKPLLDQQSQKLLLDCMNVIKPGLRIVCRLYWRKEAWYRLEKLKEVLKDKKELIEDNIFNEILNCLLQKKLLVDNNIAQKENLNLNEFIDLLSLKEVKEVCKDLKLKASNKEEAKQSLQSFSKQSSIGKFLGMKVSDNKERVLKMLCSKVGPCYKLSEDARRTLDELYTLMYLGIDWNILKEKKLELMLLNDKINRETYPIDKSMEIDNASVVFQNREEFQRYLGAIRLYDTFLDTSDVAERCAIVRRVYDMYLNITKEDMTSYKALPVWLRGFTPAQVYVKVLESGIVALKKVAESREDNCKLALEILTTLIGQNAFRVHKKPSWCDEKALIYENILKQPHEAAKVLLEGFKLNLRKEELDCMRPRALKLINRQTNKLDEELAKQLRKHVSDCEVVAEKNISARHLYKQPMESAGHGKIKFDVRTSGGRAVYDAEEYCKHVYIQSGEYTHGEHWEGRIVTTLFFLLFWDIIYMSVRTARGVFLSYYQTYPLDLFNGFYANRQTLIDDRLAEIEAWTTEELVDRLTLAWNSRAEGQMSGVSEAVCLPAAAAVARCAGARRTAALVARLARDYRYSHSGFPDLTMWNENNGQLLFVEVKTDSDKPSIKQIQWMNYLRAHDIQTEFCYVGVNTTRCKARNADNS